MSNNDSRQAKTLIISTPALCTINKIVHGVINKCIDDGEKEQQHGGEEIDAATVYEMGCSEDKIFCVYGHVILKPY